LKLRKAETAWAGNKERAIFDRMASENAAAKCANIVGGIFPAPRSNLQRS
jgi:hypothetical protein